jgi:hypothetical protein
MQLGRTLHQLWRLKRSVALAFALALLISVTSVYKVGLLPPSLKSRGLEIGAASTYVLIDTPNSKVVDIRAQTNDFQSLITRTNLLGNVMASPPVRGFIARRAHIPQDLIQAQAPATPDSEKRASDILRASDKYRLSIEASPSVPILSVYAEAPTGAGAVKVANAAVDGLQDYLNTLAAQQRLPAYQQVRLKQLGRATGGVINGGVKLEVGGLTFVVVFVLCCAALLGFRRIRRGWKSAVEQEWAEQEEWAFEQEDWAEVRS